MLFCDLQVEKDLIQAQEYLNKNDYDRAGDDFISSLYTCNTATVLFGFISLIREPFWGQATL